MNVSVLTLFCLCFTVLFLECIWLIIRIEGLRINLCFISILARENHPSIQRPVGYLSKSLLCANTDRPFFDIDNDSISCTSRNVTLLHLKYLYTLYSHYLIMRDLILCKNKTAILFQFVISFSSLHILK